jgi:uncharacterized protein YbaP (TraB family)
MAFSKCRRLALVATAMLGACAQPAARPAAAVPPAPQPALWKLADDDTTIYLFGTIHLLPPDTPWRTARFDQALAEAKTLVVEVKLPDDPTATAQVMVRLGSSPGLPPLIERVPGDKREALRAAVAASGFPPALLDGMETWAAALTLASGALVKLGYDPALGVERQLTRDLAQTGKTIVGLETAEEQLGFFDALSEPAQRAFLVSTLDDPARTKKEFQAMLNAWLAGDVKAIARTFDSETALSPELREVLMRKRNRKWAEWLAQRLDQPGTVFVAVGAGHLVGPDSVQHMLKARGLRTRRLQ